MHRTREPRTNARKLTPSPSMVVAIMALIVALSGTAYAAATITGKQIKNSSLTGADVKNSSLTGSDIKNASVGSVDLKAEAKAALTGPKGDTGAAGTARAYAQFDQSTNVLIAARTKGIVSVSSPSTGVYCLQVDPATGINPANTAAVVSPEFGSSSGNQPRTVEIRGINTNSCDADEFAVHTFAEAAPSDGVSFTILVP